jgi:hypothetical protein
MSSYFDKASAEVGDASRRYWSGSNSLGFLNAAADIEDRVIAQVNLVTGDREFPDDSSGNGSEAIARRAGVSGSACAITSQRRSIAASPASTRSGSSQRLRRAGNETHRDDPTGPERGARTRELSRARAAYPPARLPEVRARER